MSGSLGIKIGTVCFATAAEAESPRAAAAARGASSPATSRHAATLIMSHDMAPTLAPLADDASSMAPGLAVNGFVDRVGDPIDLIAADGSAHRPEALVAGAVRYLTRYSAGAFTGPPAIAATYPSHWKPHGVQALREALDRMDMTGVALVTEVDSVLARVESLRGLPDDGAVVVYDLGGNGLSVSVARGTQQIGSTIRSAEFGGSHIDDAIVQQVLRALDGELADVDLADPALLAPLRAVRSRCRQAKETLSAETAAVVEVELGRVRHDVRLVRSELEELIREPVAGSVGLVGEALRANDIDAREVRAVVLAGGAAATPLVAELLSSEFHVPVTGEPEPLLTSAKGAALLARSSVSAAASVPVSSIPEAKPPTPKRESEPDPSAGAVASKPPMAIAPPASVAAERTGGGEVTGGRRQRTYLAAAAIAALAAGVVGVFAIAGPGTGPKPAVNEQVLIPPAGPNAERPDGTGTGTGRTGTGGASDTGSTGSGAGQAPSGGGSGAGGANGTGSTGSGSGGANGGGAGQAPAGGGAGAGGSNGTGPTGSGSDGANGGGAGQAPSGGGSGTGGANGTGSTGAGSGGTNGTGTGTGGSDGTGSTGAGSGGANGGGAGQAPAGGGSGSGGTNGADTGGAGQAPAGGGSGTGGANDTGSTGSGSGGANGAGAGGTGPAPTGTATGGTGAGTGGTGTSTP
ncbi:Hsp70 family protein [Nocardia lijiangensis]|uniref:Hsp70 family protein n=1 Tax=Nocardia lijiangensis TaxID=299618 RepID=UPI000A41A63B|nr:Hsp70 family protein [Nocardia lijiangensis]